MMSYIHTGLSWPALLHKNIGHLVDCILPMMWFPLWKAVLVTSLRFTNWPHSHTVGCVTGIWFAFQMKSSKQKAMSKIAGYSKCSLWLTCSALLDNIWILSSSVALCLCPPYNK